MHSSSSAAEVSGAIEGKPLALDTGAAEGSATTAAAKHLVSHTYYPWFDALRALLAGAVALSHDGVLDWAHSGDLAVHVFFALSGFLIGGILVESQVGDMARFYFNRATRIWIPYAVAMALLLGLSLLRDPITPKWFEYVFYKVTFVYNWFGVMQNYDAAHMPLHGTGHHFWSICAEEQFYLVAPLLLVLLPSRIGRSPWLWAAISLLAVYNYTYGAITLGVLAAVLKARHGHEWYRHRASRALSWLVVIACTAAMALYEPLYMWVAPPFSLAVVLLLSREGKKNKIAAFFGGVSYPFYLNHWVGVFGAHALFGLFDMRESAAAKVFAFVANVAFCSLLYVFVDKQVMRKRESWFTPKLGRGLAVAAFASVFVGLAGGFYLTRDLPPRPLAPDAAHATEPDTTAGGH
jgi:peptidoglycan/LPS O-acetylase OafA/YrhL